MNMEEIVLLNDNIRQEEPGDVAIYRDRAHACRGIEPNDVDPLRLRAITASGLSLRVHTDGRAVWMTDDETRPLDPTFVRKALQHSLRELHGVRKRTWVSEEDDNETLISAIGFER